MLTVQVEAIVDEHGRLEADVSGRMPAGKHRVSITIPEPETPKPGTFRIEDFPMNEYPWDDSVSLRREDMYGDDGR